MSNPELIGVTERGDAALDLSWEDWVFRQRRPAVLISKDPCKLFTAVMSMRSKWGQQPNIIVHCTITGLGGTKIEPGVPDASTSLAGYRDFVRELGKDRVVLRCDPIIPTEKFVSYAVSKVMSQSCGTRIRFSFLDMYGHVKMRFANAGIDVTKLGFEDENLHASQASRLKLIEQMKSSIADPSLLQACGEPGVQSEPCISRRDCDILGVKFMDPAFAQRFVCHCAANKTELLSMKGRCKHGCLYCYWKDQKDYFIGR